MEELFVRHGEHLLLRRFVDTMAQSVSAELNILDPDYVLVGGGVVNMAGFPRQMLLDRIREHCRKPYPAENLELIFTEEEEVLSVIEKAICFYRDNGQPGERFADTIGRIGFEAVEKALLE